MREKRKDDHIFLASITKDGPSSTGFEDVYLIHQAISELHIDEIDLSCELFNKKLDLPLILNAITGGTQQAADLNRMFARMARSYNIAMAVGSQTIAIKSSHLEKTFNVVREENPDGVIIANIGANRKVDEVIKAIEMINADAIQLHLNIPQELAMREGDRDFRGILQNIKEIIENCPVPVIAKEVGFGLSKEVIESLYDIGVRYFDIGGKGGTNFIAIEDQRQGLLGGEFDDWGISTACSLAETISLKLPVTVIASGGIRSTLDITKALAMGANFTGIAGSFLRLLVNKGKNELDQTIMNLIYRLKVAFLMCGASNIAQLQQKPVIILGKTEQYLKARNIDVKLWSKA